MRQKLELDLNNKDEEDFLKSLINVRKMKINDIKEILRKRIEQYKIGSILIIFDDFVISARKGKNNLNLMIPENKLGNIIYFLNKYLFK